MTSSRSYAPLTALTLLTLVSILPGECALEPTVIAERYYTSGRSERHQKTSPTLPYGAPIPDNYGPGTTSGSTDIKTETSGAAGSGVSTGSSSTQTNTTGSTSAGAGIVTPTSATTEQGTKAPDAGSTNSTDAKAQPSSQSTRKGITTGRRGRHGTSFTLPEEIGRIEGTRDMNIFQVEPTVINEEYYASGKSERQQHISTTLPIGAPIPDRYTNAELQAEGVKPMKVEAVNTTPTAKPAEVPNTK